MCVHAFLASSSSRALVLLMSNASIHMQRDSHTFATRHTAPGGRYPYTLQNWRMGYPAEYKIIAVATSHTSARSRVHEIKAADFFL